MKKKQAFAILLTFILVIGLMSGCGNSESSSDTKSVSVKEVTEESSAADSAKSAEESKAEAETGSEPEAASASETEAASAEESSAVSEPAEDDATAESLLNGYYDIADDIQSIAFDMLLDLDMKMSAMGEDSSTNMQMDIHYETDGENAYMNGSMKTDAEGEQVTEEVEQYIIKEGDELVTYSYDRETDSWSNNGSAEVISISKELIPRPDPSVFTLETEGDQYKVSGKVEMQDVLKNSGEAMNELFEGFVGATGDSLTGKVDLEYCFNKETHDLESVNIDLSAVMEETFKALIEGFLAMGESDESSDEETDLSSMFNISVDKFAFTISDIVMDEDLQIALPNGVKEALEQEEDEEDSSAGSDASDSSDANASSFETFTPIDNDECAVTVKEITDDDDYAYKVKFTLENKSSDKKYTYISDSVYVNNLKVNAYLYDDVAAGKKSNQEMSLYKDELEEYGIDDITDIEIAFEVRDSEDWSLDPVAKETFHVYPLGKKNATVFEREAQKTDNVLVDNDDITVIATSEHMDEGFGYTVDLYLVNKTDSVVQYSAEDTSLNGFMVDSYFGTELNPGKSAFGQMSWYSDTLEENDIEKVEEIEFTLRVYDPENWSDPLYNETVTIKP